MHREQQLNDLLVRWHHWVQDPVRLPDTLLLDFDAALSRMDLKHRVALVTEALNLRCGVHVWVSPRSEPGDTESARAAMCTALVGDNETRWFGKTVIQLNERGNRIGESNPRAKLSDERVNELLTLRDQGKSYGELATMFECSKSAVQWYCNGGRRGQVPARLKEA